MDDDLLATRIAEAAEAGETEWLTYQSFISRFGIITKQQHASLGSQLHALGWWLEPNSIKDYEIIPNAFGDGQPEPSGQPQGVRLRRT